MGRQMLATKMAPSYRYHIRKMVGMAGFEPATSCSQSRRANQAALHPGGPAVAYLLLATHA
jgi:hypothetical protein